MDTISPTHELSERNHSPLFHIHEPALKYGVRSLAYLAIDYLRRTG